jgi:hypothetical protein
MIGNIMCAFHMVSSHGPTNAHLQDVTSSVSVQRHVNKLSGKQHAQMDSGKQHAQMDSGKQHAQMDSGKQQAQMDRAIYLPVPSSHDVMIADMLEYVSLFCDASKQPRCHDCRHAGICEFVLFRLHREMQ